MSMSADIHDTILSFCVANKIPQDKAIALLRDIVDDMNGDGDSYDFSFVANVYASEQARRPTPLAPDEATPCPVCGDDLFRCSTCQEAHEKRLAGKA